MANWNQHSGSRFAVVSRASIILTVITHTKSFPETQTLKRRDIALSVILSLLSLPTFSQQSERDDDIRARIRKEGMEHSQILKTMHMLADVYGPRLTNTYAPTANEAVPETEEKNPSRIEKNLVSTDNLKNTFILLIGFAGTGKYSISTRIQSLIPSTRIYVRLM